jgi:hypothetical protein
MLIIINGLFVIANSVIILRYGINNGRFFTALNIFVIIGGAVCIILGGAQELGFIEKAPSYVETVQDNQTTNTQTIKYKE